MGTRPQEVCGAGRTTLSPLALVRVFRGLSQKELGARAGVSKQTVIDLEHGRRTPRISTAVAIAAVFGVDDPRLLFPDAFASLNDQRPVADTPGADTSTAVGGPLDDASYSP